MADKEHPSPAAVVKENARRREALKIEYNPFTGVGSPLERKPLKLGPNKTVHLPVDMWEEELVKGIHKQGGIQQVAAKMEEEEETVFKVFNDLRFQYDYEFWCATCATITDEMGEEIPLILNPPQRQSLAEREELRRSGVPVRQIELKHRQYGSTTEKNAYAYWLQNIVHGGYAAYICSLDATAATKIVGRYKVIVDNYPREHKRLTLKPYMGLRNTYQIPETKARVNVGTAQNPNAPSGDTTQIVLISEAGKMKSTAEQGADKLITNMVSMVPLRPKTYIMIESTAEISGQWFRNEVYSAINGDSAFKLTFVNWLADDSCRLDLPEDMDPIKFVESFEQYDWYLWEDEGASLEQIYWYRTKKKEYQNDWQMKQENPTNVQEAFQSTGLRKFPPHYVANLRRDTTKPKLVGDLVADDVKGPGAFKNIRFEPNPDGCLMIWSTPDDITPEHPVTNRFCSFGDIGGTTEKADWSVLTVMDRYWMMMGGLPERVATWRGHLDQDLVAWKFAQVSYWYSKALLAVESNSLDKEKSEGDHSLTILDEIKDHYYWLYTRTDRDKVEEGKPLKYGFHTNHATKAMIINRLVAAARDEEYVERDKRACNEMDYFEIKEDGKMGAIEGMHDDIVITTAGAVWLALNYMQPPQFDKSLEELRTRKPRRQTEAMI